MYFTFPRALRDLLRRSVILSLVASGAVGAPDPKAAADFTTPTQDPMLAQVFPSIVRIEAIRLRPSDGRLTKQWIGGSGVIISPEGHVLTNCHVTEDGDYFRCYLFDGSHVDAQRVGQDALTDLAVLKLDLSQRAKDAPPLVIARFGDSDKLSAGDVVFALGSPGFLSQSVTRGIVSNPSLVLPEQTAGKMILRGEDVGTLVRWILHDARIFGGNSGGPLVNSRGEIVGINELGVFNLSGAIPGNLGRGVAESLIAHGRVTRGWSGLTVQPRLESDGPGPGVVVGDVAENSPAARAGMQPGDLVIACDGHTIQDAQEKAVEHFNWLETSKLPENEFAIDYLRAGKSMSVHLKLARREPAQADDVELRGWGAVVRDLTPTVVREELLPDERGIWLENIGPAGPCGQAEPILQHGDVLIGVDGQAVNNVAELRALTNKLMAESRGKAHTVLASVRRDGEVLSSVVELRETNEHNVTQLARKAWLGAASQPLTPKLGARLAIKAEGGARLTRIYAGTQAEEAGLRVGDVILAIDGMEVTARRPEDTDVLARQIRQYHSGATAVFSIWRDGRKMDVNVLLEQQPAPSAEAPWWEDTVLEFSAHDVSFDDRSRLQLPPGTKGAVVESAVPAGWASLAGLRSDDLVETADGVAVGSVAELRESRELAEKNHRTWWVLLVKRRGQSHLIEINLKPTQSKS